MASRWAWSALLWTERDKARLGCLSQDELLYTRASSCCFCLWFPLHFTEWRSMGVGTKRPYRLCPDKFPLGAAELVTEGMCK